jgi:uncharacterized protein YjbJ (UPF0337 family)
MISRRVAGYTAHLNPRAFTRPGFAQRARGGRENPFPTTERSDAMDDNRTQGAKREIKGAIKEVVGKVTGNDSKELAGNVEKNLGKVQRKAGEASDEIREAARKDD